ncbi:MAG: epoxyqueuosine reductase [Veillonella sp.]|uniref:epoxyqueuosine reductase n=1 Tax=Veillonella sp. TaxID=1926307 RepID=UPI0025EB9781|nr:QueG-associated DUF1730 domain-containing protein [Veillonella sp.]MBS4913429.1 epoxyqueuosine reductase [Veillonella sp.]
MITRNHIKKLTEQLNIPAFGIAQWPLPESARDFIHTDNPCPFINGTLEERLTGNTAINAKSAIVCLFPYYVPPKLVIPNLPKYAWANDYHLVVRDYLTRLGESLQALDNRVVFEVHCDTSPLADRYMAYLAGLGVFGKNRALINPTWGSYTNIGTLLTNLDLPVDSPMEGTCLGCNRCVKSCPGQSLGGKEFRYETCKSYLTQKKGALPDDEVSIIQKSPLVWGCDICQDVCPHNRNVPLTPIKEFQRIEPRIDPTVLEPMTNRQFKEAFGHRAFAWRGKATLWRNCQIIEAGMKDQGADKEANHSDTPSNP